MMLHPSHPNIFPLARQRKALLLGINYDDSNSTMIPLRYPQRDAKEMRQLLKETFGFHDEDIIVLIDDEAEVEAGTSLLPTRENIMREVSGFINRGQDNMDYVLFYSGHVNQHCEKNPVKEDWLQAFIIPVNTKSDKYGECFPDSVIYDEFLHKSIIVPLEETKGCHLFAVIDAPYSGTLLNLRHHRCNRIGTVTSAVRHACRCYIVEDLVVPFYKDVLVSTYDDVLTSIYDAFFQKTTPQLPEAETPRPSPFRCNGFCPRVPNSSRKSTVICVSASKSSEVTLEGHNFDTLSSAIIKLLEKNPNASIKDAIYTARGAVKRLHQGALNALGSLGFQIALWNPQLASNYPVDHNTMLMYPETRHQEPGQPDV